MSLGRTCSLAIVGLAALSLGDAGAQELDAGKTAAELFRANCAGCHSSPRGLAQANNVLDLKGFLQRHYTASPQSAFALANFLMGEGRGERTTSVTGSIERRPHRALAEPGRRAPRIRGAVQPRDDNPRAQCPDYSCFSLYGAYGP